MKLFKATTGNFKSYYVMANDYNAAVAKVEAYREQEVQCPVVSSDGSLNILGEDDNKIVEVRLLTDEVIR